MIKRPPALIFGIPIDDLTMDDTLDVVERLVRTGRAKTRTHQVATINVDFLVGALDDSFLRTLLQRCDVCLADGQMVVWAARLCGMRVRERVAGADLVPNLVERSQTTGWRVLSFGAAPKIATSARSLLIGRYPRAQFWTDSGPMMSDVTIVPDQVLDDIAAYDADVLCVALGNPKQERFIDAHRNRLRTPIMIGIGGSLDMLVGGKRRAPRLIQQIGFEWLFRAAQEPKRLGRRYARDIRVFGPRLVREWVAVRRRRSWSGLRLTTMEGVVTASILGSAIPSIEDWSTAADKITLGATLVIDPGTSDDICDRALAHLVGLVRVARFADSNIVWTTEPTRLATSIHELGVTPYLLGLSGGKATS